MRDRREDDDGQLLRSGTPGQVVGGGETRNASADDSDIAEYIASLEERESETDVPEVDLPEASGEAIAKEFERYLRRRDDPPAR